MEFNKDLVLTSVFMALEGAFAYSAFLPSIMTIGTFVDTPEKVKMIREGEIVGTGFLVMLSLTVAYITRSPIPLVAGLAAGGLAIGVYEYALRKAPVNLAGNDDNSGGYHIPVEY
jgi:inactivated superfamily I helicase